MWNRPTNSGCDKGNQYCLLDSCEVGRASCNDLAMTVIEEPVLNALCRSYGESFLRYLLAIPEDTLLASALKAVHMLPLQHLIDLRTHTLSGPGEFPHLDLTFNAANHFTARTSGSDLTLAQRLRQLCGGQVENSQVTGNALLDTVSKIARDVWPALLLTSLETNFPKTFSMGILPQATSHPELTDACRLILEDGDLRKLFMSSGQEVPQELKREELVGIAANWVTNDMSGGTRYLQMMPGAIIFNASILAQIEGRTLTFDGLVEKLAPAIDFFRQFSSGAEVLVPAFVGFHGATVPAGVCVDLGESGVLRSPTEIEKTLLFMKSDRVSAVLETSFPVKLYEVLPMATSDVDAYFAAFEQRQSETRAIARKFQSQVDRIRYAILLASQEERTLGVRIVSRYIVDFSSGSSGHLWDEHLDLPRSHELDEDDAARIRDIHHRILEGHTDSLEISQRRLLSAATNRRDAGDAFIDAVIVWENAFGSSFETMFRVTAAIAQLLEPENPVNRQQLWKELKDLYGQRSRFVHGGKEPRENDLQVMRDRAIWIAIRLLKAMYEARTDLLAQKAEERSATLLLDF